MEERKFISVDMLKEARDNGWGYLKAAKEFNVKASTIAMACHKFGIQLPAPNVAATWVKAESVEEVGEPIPVEPRKPSWSCSPDAIMRALKRAGKA